VDSVLDPFTDVIRDGARKLIGQAGGHPADVATLLDDRPQEHRTGITSQSVNATFDAQRAVEARDDNL